MQKFFVAISLICLIISTVERRLIMSSVSTLRKAKLTVTIEKDIEAYYLSLTEKEKKEDREWTKIAEESAKRTWND